MVEADPVMRAARSGFGVVMVALILAWAALFVFRDETNQILFLVWMIGAAAFYASKYYYQRGTDTPTDASAERDRSTERDGSDQTEESDGNAE